MTASQTLQLTVQQELLSNDKSKLRPVCPGNNSYAGVLKESTRNTGTVSQAENPDSIWDMNNVEATSRKEISTDVTQKKPLRVAIPQRSSSLRTELALSNQNNNIQQNSSSQNDDGCQLSTVEKRRKRRQQRVQCTR